MRLWTLGRAGARDRRPAGDAGTRVDAVLPRSTGVRTDASILHLDLDAFFAAVEQRDKPSLRGKPVIVGGIGGRGVVATASYEAREFGVGRRCRAREARARCPHAAFLSGRFHAYRDDQRAVMQVLRELSPLVEPLSLDEAFVDLAAADLPDLEVETVTAVGRRAPAPRARGDRRADRDRRHRARRSSSPRSRASSTSPTG